MPANSDLEDILVNNQALTTLEIDLGDNLLFKLDTVDGFLKTRFIGMLENQYLISTMPKGHIMIRDKFFEGNTVLVRYLHNGSIFAFQSQIVGVVDHPDKLFFLSYPAIISRQELRREPRVDCRLKAVIDSGSARQNGVVIDISRSGCRFTLKSPLKVKLNQRQNVNMRMNLDDSQDAVTLTGNIRSMENSNQSMILGIQFLEIDKTGQRLIDNYVNDHSYKT